MGYRLYVASLLLVTWILVTGVAISEAKMMTIEGEDMINSGLVINERKSASKQKAIHMSQNDIIFFELCTMSSNTTVQVENVAYSNDGGGDRIQVAIDNIILGVFDTTAKSDGGREWDRFRSFGTFPLKTIPEGRHRLSLKVLRSDTYGVEIDVVRVKIGDTQSKESLECNIFCFDSITYLDDMPTNSTIPVQATAIQRSVKTQCAEEDNINVPVFHSSASKFVISASLPKYTSFSNNRGSDWSNCQMVTAFWNFTNLTFNRHFLNQHTETAQILYDISTSTDLNEHIGTIFVDFELEGPSTGSTNSEIGTTVSLFGIKSAGNVNLTFQFYGRKNVWSDPQSVFITGMQQSVVFSTPDFAFSEGKGNSLKIGLFGNKALVGDISVNEIRMYMRNMEYDQSVSIYNDGVTIVETVDMDMWWRINETMTVKLHSNERNYRNVDYMRIYQKVPWSDKGYAQVFVLYQDGNVRLLPVTPHGLDWIPFGSSVLIGQSDTASKRPCAPIVHVDVDPVTLKIKIYYLDGGSIHLQIKTALMETQLVISESTYTRDLELFPFFTFRSMWVTDGNGDVDHITVDGTETHAILGKWASLQGNFFAFYRKCISRHNTLSPDIRLNILA